MLNLNQFKKISCTCPSKNLFPFLLGIFFCFGLLYPLEAQELNFRGILNLNYLDYNNKIPEEVLTGKTVVLIEDDVTRTKNKSLPWQALARKAHPTFHLLGIDAVAYYNLDLILSGPTVTKSFAEDIKGRAISHAMLLQRELLPSGDTVFTLTLGKISEESVFFEAGQQAYQLQKNNFATLMQEFTKTVSGSGLKNTNFLILEIPEFFDKTQIFTSKRFESYNPDLKLDKLAVPLFEERAVPKNTPPGMSREEMIAQINKENQNIQQANARLESIMKGYPFSSAPVSFREGEAAWIKAGNHFVLLSIHGKAETVRRLLNYERVDDQPTYTSTRIVGGEPVTQEIAKNQEVYKFYIKHLHSGEVYLGTHWDAATTWDQALENFILNLKADFNIEARNSN